jgi:carbon starvation protein CstA
MMGAMALLIAAVWLRDHGRRWLFAAVPSAILFATTFASLGLSLAKNLASAHHILVLACGVLILLGAGTLALGIQRLLQPLSRDGRNE